MIPSLNKGDRVAIICPAKKLPSPMTKAIELLQSWGLEVVLGDTVSASYHQFAGDDALRARDLQRFVDDDSIKAIFAARGGYGTIRIIDNVDFSRLQSNPKWIIGFSDITVLHSHLHTLYGMPTIHGQMPINVTDASAISLESLHKVLFGEPLAYNLNGHPNNRIGYADAQVIGGNLSLLVALLGSVSDTNYSGKILFIEDVGEYFYSVDRMLYALKRAGKLSELAGLIVGGFSEMKDNDIPFGQTVPEIIMHLVKDYNYPVCFDFPAGHIPDNRALIFGQRMKLDVQQNNVTAQYT